MLLFDKELRPEIIFGYQLIVLDGHRSDTSKDKILRYLICKGFHSNEKDVRRSKSTLLLDIEIDSS